MPLTPVSTEWYDQPITAQDVSDAVSRFAPALPPTEFAAFCDWNVDRWAGVIWHEATGWDLAAEWRAFTAERSKA